MVGFLLQIVTNKLHHMLLQDVTGNVREFCATWKVSKLTLFTNTHSGQQKPNVKCKKEAYSCGAAVILCLLLITQLLSTQCRLLFRGITEWLHARAVTVYLSQANSKSMQCNAYLLPTESFLHDPQQQ